MPITIPIKKNTLWHLIPAIRAGAGIPTKQILAAATLAAAAARDIDIVTFGDVLRPRNKDGAVCVVHSVRYSVTSAAATVAVVGLYKNGVLISQSAATLTPNSTTGAQFAAVELRDQYGSGIPFVVGDSLSLRCTTLTGGTADIVKAVVGSMEFGVSA